MALAIDWPTKTFSVPQSDLTPVSGTLFELDTETSFRQAVNAIMAGEEGIVFEDPISHNTEYTVTGVIYARKIEMINGYRLRFMPDGQWSVRLVGSNNNLFDVENGVLVQNQVQVISQNSAGLVRVAVTEQDVTDIAAASASSVWDEDLSQHSLPSSPATILKFLKGFHGGSLKVDPTTKQLIHLDEAGAEIARYDLKDADGQPASENVYERVRTP